MKVGVISDTHGFVKVFKKAVDNILRDTDLILHAGDVLYHGPRNKFTEEYNPEKLAEEINNLPLDILISRGNCDAAVDQMMINVPMLSEYVYLSIEGYKILLYHGDKNINFKNIDITITGHTHIYNVDFYNKTIFVNPGSLALPKNNPNGTCGVIDFSANIINIYDVNTENVLIETKF